LGLQEARARRPEGAKNVEHVGVMFRLVCVFMVVLRNDVTIERQTSMSIGGLKKQSSMKVAN
jgi:hypothetical protein